ncbi:Protein of unknown function [Gryllus bimaculatus]|nr:Protein of unknown function [Gryllus bimaculatus]
MMPDNVKHQGSIRKSTMIDMTSAKRSVLHGPGHAVDGQLSIVATDRVSGKQKRGDATQCPECCRAHLLSAHPLTINGNLRLDDDGVIAGLMHSLHDQDQGRIPRPSSDRDFPDYFCTCKKRVVLPVALLHARGRVKEIFSRD